jgi:cystathionine beta-lyase/cystathionine gamma-synthase
MPGRPAPRLKLFTAAALAVADRDPAACGLILETEQAMSVYRGNKATAARMRRLNEAAKDLCPCGSTTTSSMHIKARATPPHPQDDA